MGQDEGKKSAAVAAMEYVEEDTVVGVGTGSTVNFFIDELAGIKHKIEGAIASSVSTEERLRAHGIPLVDPNSVMDIPVYVDGADEVTPHKDMIKGGGGALTREKIVAAISRSFVCIVDESKVVDILGRFPLPVEVIPMAQSYVARQLAALGGQPVLREGFTTDNGNIILDVHNLKILDPPGMESTINQITGVVTNGLFSRRGADIVLVGSTNGVKVLK
ncbi:MAG: ribose-5-phosphate isomerase RpiA [Gammaproteobacteria bacterium]|nr:ribose-5-phosphate isomerase RpiA [Gammaproteobacteria bacterium]